MKVIPADSDEVIQITAMPSDRDEEKQVIAIPADRDEVKEELTMPMPALWATMKKDNISTIFIRVIKNLYDKANSAVVFNSSVGDWFRTTVGVQQGCLLSPTLFNIFLERIMTDALEYHDGTVSIGSRA